MKRIILPFLSVLLVFASCKKEKTPAPPVVTDPAITAISPTSGQKNTVVTITGTNFGTSTTALKVYFNGVQGVVQTATGNSITASVPVGAQTGIVKVEKNAVQVNGPQFTYLPTYTTSTFAGFNQGYADGNGTAASFNVPSGVTRDASGNIYVADRDNHRIRKITPAGVVTTFAGSGTAGFVNGNGTAAQFNQPYSITIDGAGNLYVGDRMNHSIRKITPAGVVSTLAGDGNGGMINGTGSGARFNEPLGVAADAAGNVYVADYINSLVRKVTPAGVATTFAGSGGFSLTDGTGTAASFSGPFGICLDASGNLFIGDYNNNAIRKITPAAVVTTVAGNGSQGILDGNGASARFNRPAGLIADASGNLIVCDAFNNTIRKISNSGEVVTIAGGVSSGGSDGTGTSSSFFTPIALCADVSTNTIYIADFNNNRIRKIIVD
ncbi:MAG: IPT/TIG domain-containing protein [Chitinophagaceae bacterium]|nr:IPT/TIG domain-containing protein [Chitinophagaceae bacterium]